jgi:N-acetylneuraminic acid mutarotase
LGKTVALVLVLVFLTESCTVIAEPAFSDETTENSWTTLAPMPTARGGLDAAVADGKIYAIGGGVGASNKNEEYDPTTNTWAIKAAIPTGRSNLATVTIQNKIYAIGGSADEYPWMPIAKNEVYDPSTNTWATKAEMPTARTQMCANNVNDQIYVVGGFESAGSTVKPSNKTEAYDPITDTWTVKAEMLYPEVYHSSVVIGAKIYVLTSPFQIGRNQVSDSPIQIYDTKTNSWSLGPFLPTTQSSADAVLILDEQGRELIYIFGGGGYDTYSDLVQIYDPENDVWGVGSPMPTPRQGLAVAVVNNQVYALGGATSGGAYGTKLSTNERCTPLKSGSLLPTPTPTSSPQTAPVPTPTEEPQQPEQDMTVGAIFAVASIVVFLCLLFYFIKRK